MKSNETSEVEIFVVKDDTSTVFSVADGGKEIDPTEGIGLVINQVPPNYGIVYDAYENLISELSKRWLGTGSLSLHCPHCGASVEYKTLEDIPREDVPCECGKFWFLKRREAS